MHASLKVLSLLLSYPTADLPAALPEIEQRLPSDTLIGARERKAIVELATDIAGMDLYDAQERYVYLFDRTRSLSLHLFEHVHGESRDRGQAMVGLMELYESNGMEIDARELPDYLPLFLEYLSTRSAEEACALLGQAAHIVAALATRLNKRDSVYAKAFTVLENLAINEPDTRKLNEILTQPEDDPSDLEALDSIWTEETVTFGGGVDADQRIGLDQLRAELKSTTLKGESAAGSVRASAKASAPTQERYS